MKHIAQIRKESLRHSRMWIGFALLMAAILLFALSVFLKKNQTQIMEQNTRYMENTATQTAYRVDDVLLNAEHAIATIADLYGQTMTSAEPDMELLEQIADETLFDFVEFVDADGMDWTMDGKSTDVSDREYFKNAMAGETGTCVVYNSRITHETLIVFYTPLYYQGSIVGVLKGHYQEDRMQQILEENYFGEQATSYLCESDGTIIARSGSAGTAENISEIFTDSLLGEEERQSFLNSLKNLESCSFTIEGSGGDTSGYLAQLSELDWSIVQVFPSFETASMMQEVQHAALILAAEIAAIFGVYILLILLSARKRQLQLKKEKTDAEQIVEGINRLFSRFVVINLAEDSYYYLEDYSNMPSRIPRKGTYSDFVDHFQQKIIETSGDIPLQDALTIQYLREHLESDTPFLRFEFLIRRDQGDRWENAAFICLSRKKERPVSVLFAIQDVTDIKQIEIHQREALEVAFQTAEEANNAKSDFLSRMSHDIRTPMNAIMGMTAIASMHMDEPDRLRDCLDKIAASGRHLLGLINEVLDMSRIESGQIRLSEQPFSLRDCIQNTRDMFLLQIEEKGLTLELHDLPREHDLVYGDPQRLQRILSNILGNAAKFTPQGGKITLTTREKPCSMQGSACFELICEDTGEGMDEALLNQIFEPFTRARDSRTEKASGTGLGLPIARNLARLMGGDIRAESQPGKGSRFTVELVLKLYKDAALPEAETQAASLPESVSFPGKRVLLVEDNELNAEIALEFLQDMGIDADTAEDGQKALELLLASEKCPYDLVLMDIQMPVMNGYEATRAIRASGRSDLEQLPILAMTANAFQEDVNNARAAGMNGHLSKPISPEQLAAALKPFFSGSGEIR